MLAKAPVAGICEDRRCDKRGDSSRQVWYCNACASCLCDVCWDLSPIHSAPGAPSHEKLAYYDYLMCNRLARILNPPTIQNEIEMLHEKDTNTTWFGIERFDDGRPFLQDFETLSHLMANCPNPEQVKYPQLVSFVGETSAGKSTLVKMLIDHEESKTDPAIVSTFPSPVAGSPINDSVPTSADVHLYSDPATWGTERPILYADCEGLNAGERVPMGAHGKRIARLDNSRRLGLRVRPLEWANSDEMKTRQYAVTHIYPRLLYTFSDVVVFVLDKPKVFEQTVLPKLFDWASGSLEASTNQGSLPHAVIALNFTGININPTLWNVPNATKALLDVNKHVLESVNGVPKLQKLAEKWRRKNKRIHSILDLIHCYYASFQVVRLPDEKNLLLLSKQVSQLHTTILERCEVAYFNKKRARLLSSAEEFGFFIQQAFSHFSINLEQPFDFKEYSLRRNPIPQNLGDYILRMAISLQSKFPDESGQWIFDKLSFMVASCFLYDCITYRKGQPQDLFGDYLPNFENALTEFCSMHWPCEFSNKKGRCVNISKRHDSKGHQSESGKVLAAGRYQSGFTAEKYKVTWMNSLKTRLAELQADLKRVEDASADLENPLISIRKQHMENIVRFFYAVGGASNFTSHATCLCCLMRSPEHALRCGHVLCSSCIKSFGVVEKATIEMQYCPLHPFDTKWERPWKIRMKPDFAGIRVLSLDGGGIRGIAELEVLRQIQHKLGVNIPITAFFDLIVGTSTGGIIALALGVKQWSVEKCIEEFKRLCHKAFTPREFHGVWGFQHLATAHHGSKWSTSPLYDALKESLGRRYLFGGDQDSDTSYSARVAVTASSETAIKGVVIANYCRKGGQQNYEFLRPNDPHYEMETWEAGAATAAAAPYFKPFIHQKTNASYLDGAFYNNNPVKVGHLERQLLWTDVQNKPPDIFLSIGTSQDRKQVELGAKEIARQIPESKGNNLSATDAKTSSKWRHFGGLVHVGKAAFHVLGDAINCERQWNEFLEITVEQKERNRYIRINPDIGHTPPQLDAKEEVDQLQADVSRATMKYRSQLELESIGFRLIASSFYFDKGPATRSRTGGTATVPGKLHCRFEKSSEWLKQLGYFFKKQQRTDFQPYFEVWNGLPQHNKQKIPLNEHVVDRLASHGDFSIDEASIVVSTTECNADIKLYFFATSGNVHGYSISGFPRDFLAEDDWILRGSEDDDEEEKDKEEPHGLNRARTRRWISTTQDQGLERKASNWHLRSSSEQNLSTQPHGIIEENRRKSDDVVPKCDTRAEVSQRSPSLKAILHNKKSRKGLSRRDNDIDQESVQQLPNSIGPQRAPSILVTPTVSTERPGQNFRPHSDPSFSYATNNNPSQDWSNDPHTSTYYPESAQITRNQSPAYSLHDTPSHYEPYQYPNSDQASSSTTPRYPDPSHQSNFSVDRHLNAETPPVGDLPRDPEDDFERELEMAKRASLLDLEKIREEEEYRQALENSVLHK